MFSADTLFQKHPGSPSDRAPGKLGYREHVMKDAERLARHRHHLVDVSRTVRPTDCLTRTQDVRVCDSQQIL